MYMHIWVMLVIAILHVHVDGKRVVDWCMTSFKSFEIYRCTFSYNGHKAFKKFFTLNFTCSPIATPLPHPLNACDIHGYFSHVLSFPCLHWTNLYLDLQLLQKVMKSCLIAVQWRVLTDYNLLLECNIMYFPQVLPSTCHAFYSTSLVSFSCLLG